MSNPIQQADVGRRKFTADEDDHLRALVLQFGPRDWVTIGRHMPGRNPRQCRHRYNNYLIDDHQFTAWTESEEETLIAKYRELGPRWVKIATHLPGRTGNEVKNRWNKHILKRRRHEELFPQEEAKGRAFSDAPGPFDGFQAQKTQLSSFLLFVLN
jgi:hypothetical protein